MKWGVLWDCALSQWDLMPFPGRLLEFTVGHPLVSARELQNCLVWKPTGFVTRSVSSEALRAEEEN